MTMNDARNSKKTDAVRLGLIQRASSEDAQANLSAALEGITEAAARGAQIICLQELFLSRYFCQEENPDRFDQAESVPGPTTEALASIADELNVVIIGSVFERRAPGLFYNTAVVLDADGTLLGSYRKMHIPHDPGYYEKFYFTPGDADLSCFDTRYARICPLVCWDQWYPELARLAALEGAQLILYPTAIAWDAGEPEEERRADHDAWETIQRSHAIASGVFVAATNRVGTEGSLEFWGGSFVADPFGRVLGRAALDSPATLVVDCDLSLIETTRREWPFLRDRRVDVYGPLTARYLER